MNSRASPRGATLVELALVLPLLVSLLMFSVFLSDLVRARLKLQEASRYAAWEMTSYTLSDYAEADHARAFDVAMRAVVGETTERFKDFDSIEPDNRFGFMLRAAPVRVGIQNQPVAGLDLGRVIPRGSGGAAPEVAAAVGKTLDFLLGQLRFNTRGQVEVEISSRLSSRLLPRRYMQREERGLFTVDNWGGRDLSDMRVRNRFTLVANGWHLPDGGDAVMRPRRAGVHGGGSRHGLALQVERMTFLGVGNYLDQVGLERLSEVATFFLPDFTGPFVVAHNYKPGSGGQGCNKDRHGAHPGLNNLSTYPGLDDDRQRCFDTAPFRDTHSYDDSLYRKVFMARGENFMGCKNPEADMPNTPAADPSTSKDKNQRKIPCE